MNLHDYIRACVMPNEARQWNIMNINTTRPVTLDTGRFNDMYPRIYMSNDVQEEVTDTHAIFNHINLHERKYFEEVFAPKYGLNVKEIEAIAFAKSIERFIDNYASNKKRKLEEEINELNGQAENYRIQFFNVKERILENRMKLAGFSLKEDTAERIKKEINMIKNHKKVTKINMGVNGEYFTLEIEVKDLVLFEPVRGSYYRITNSIIVLNVENGNVNFYPAGDADENLLARGYWCDEQLHPHVDEEGVPCAGNASSQFMQFSSDLEIYAMFITALNFLQTCNINDPAGAQINNWVRCTKDGIYTDEDIDRKGKRTVCQICGREVEGGAELYVCEDCNLYICDECCEEVDGRIVCTECINENYIRCVECNELVSLEDAWDRAGDYYCYNCFCMTASDEEENTEIPY